MKVSRTGNGFATLLQEFFQGLVLILAMAASVLVNLFFGRSA